MEDQLRLEAAISWASAGTVTVSFAYRFSLDLICKYIRATIFPSTIMILDILDMACLLDLTLHFPRIKVTGCPRWVVRLG